VAPYTSSPLDRRIWTPGSELDPRSHYAADKNNVITRRFESGRQDLNLRPPGPQPERSRRTRGVSAVPGGLS
jgi:hypothetical protein